MNENNNIKDYFKPNDTQTILKDTLIMTILETEEHKIKEMHYSVRIQQIYLIIFSSVLAASYHLIYLLFRNTLFKNHFFIIDRKIVPATSVAVSFHLGYAISVIITIFMNYFAFYFIIRNSFKNFSNNNQAALDLETYYQRMSTPEIDDFLVKNNKVGFNNDITQQTFRD